MVYLEGEVSKEERHIRNLYSRRVNCMNSLEARERGPSLSEMRGERVSLLTLTKCFSSRGKSPISQESAATCTGERGKKRGPKHSVTRFRYLR